MAPLEWNNPGDRFFEAGVDRGVLYLEDGTAVAWNGLVEIKEDSASSTTPFYFDGQKYIDCQNPDDFSATLKAITFPDEFVGYDGFASHAAGLQFGNQHRKTFSLAYRTLVGDDISGTGLGYKIHIMYHLTAKPNSITHDTVDTNVDPIEFEWSLRALPERPDGFTPTSYAVVDSRYMSSTDLTALEELLYGSESSDPELPELEFLIAFLQDSHGIVITDNGDGTWTAFNVDGRLTMTGPEQFQITGVDATYLDANTYEVSSTD